MLVAGADGCPGGWVVVVADVGRRLSLQGLLVVPTFKELIARTEDCVAVGVDIPIGLPAKGPRAADIAARKVLSPTRASSVFPAPVRRALRAKSYQEACDISFGASQRKMSQQAYNIMPKIREADRAISPRLQDRIFEVHPEVSFWALNDGQPMRHSKRTPAGLQEREKLLSREFGDDLAHAGVRAGVRLDDFFDACAAAWSAWRFANGQHGTLPEDPPRDRRGLRMEIVY